MFPLPVANGKNRPTTLASTQFGGSGTVILNFFFLNILHNVSCNKFVFASRDPKGGVSVVLCYIFFWWWSATVSPDGFLVAPRVSG